MAGQKADRTVDSLVVMKAIHLAATKVDLSVDHSVDRSDSNLADPKASRSVGSMAAPSADRSASH